MKEPSRLTKAFTTGALALVIATAALASSPQKEESDANEPGTAEHPIEQLMTDGEAVYAASCSSCHGPNGDMSGGGATVIADYDRLEDTPRATRQVLWGGSNMPSFHQVLSDYDVAAVLTYVRASWGNDFGSVSVEEVEEERSRFD